MHHSEHVKDIANLYTKFNGCVTGSKVSIKSISIGNKTINGKITDIPSIVFYVKEKKPIDQIPANKLIPKTVIVDGQEYKTDVVQNSRNNYTLDSIGCYNTDIDNYAADHRKKFRWYPPTESAAATGNPVQGGISVGQTDGGTGTLGAVVADTVNNKLCALSNAHVFVEDPFLASEKLIVKQYGFPIRVRNIKNKKVSQPGPADASMVGGSANKDTGIGYVKRYVPLYYWNWNGQGEFVYFNYVDASLSSLTKTTEEVTTQSSGNSPTAGKSPFVVWSSSSKQFRMSFSSVEPATYPFASTEEINSVGIGTRVWKSGRTTGFVGKDECELEIIGIGASAEVYGYTLSQFLVAVTFSDCLRFAYKRVGNEPVPRPGAIIGGDSGSVLIADFGGTKKIIGLNFAGGYYSDQAGPGSSGYACRIDHVASLLHIDSIDTSNNLFQENNLDNPYYNSYYDDVSTWKYRAVEGLSNLKEKSAGWEQTYYQCGLYPK